MPFVLDGEGAAVPPELWFCSNKPEVLDGSLTGFGDVYDMVGYGNDSQGAESKMVGPVAFTGGVYLPNGKQRITLGAAASGLHITNVSTTVKGLLAISSYTHGDVSVTVDTMTVGSDVALMENVSATLPAGTVAIRDGALEHHVRVPTAGLIDDFSNIPFSSDAWSIVADASLTSVSNLPKAASLKVGTGASVTMQMPDSSSVLAADGTLTLTAPDDWRTKAAIWIDPSRTDLISGLGSGVLTQSAAYTNAYYTAYGTFEPLNTRLSGKLLVEQVADCRTGTRVAYNPRLYHNNAISKQPQVYLYLQGDGPNGNSYFNGGVYNKRQTGLIYVDEIGSGTSAYSGSMNDVRRVPFTTPIAAQYVTVVYNSANGGGWELIGTANGEFLRSTNTLDVGVMKTDAYEMWIDGVKVARPSTARFSGGWQVVTVKAAGVSLTGLGYTKGTYNHCGGQLFPQYLYTIAEAGGRRACVLFESAVPDALLDPAAYELYPAVGIKSVTRSTLDAREAILTFAEPLTAGATYNIAVVASANGITSEPRKAANRKFTVPDETLPSALSAANVAEIGDYELVYKHTLPSAKTSSCGTYGARYVLDKTRFKGDFSFDRVAYALHLVGKDGSEQWAWASMDAFTDKASELGIPSERRKALTQCIVTNLVVRHGYTGGTAPDLTDGDYAYGNIEFFPGNYGQANSKNIPGANASSYDFGDSPSTTKGTVYCTFQVHSYLAAQTVMAVNYLGGGDGWSAVTIPNVGIGNSTGSNPDWTVYSDGNASSYTTRDLYVFVRPTARGQTDAPSFAVAPEDTKVHFRDPLTLVAYAPTAETYQWLKDGVPIAGATGTTLDVPTEHSGTAIYAVTATDAAGHSTTASARIKVISGGTVIVFH